MTRLVLSQDYEILSRCLAAGLEENAQGLQKQWIFVPHTSLKQWLLVQLAKKSPSGCVTCYKIATIDEMLYSQFRNIPSKIEMRCFLYQKLEENRLELSKHLSTLFFSYGKYGIPTQEGWQKDLISSLPFQLPIQILPEEKAFFTEDPCHFFGFHVLPPVVWSYLKKAKTSYFYLFSPCSEFWEDLCTDQEQVRLYRRAKNGALRDYFSTAPRLLANLGKLGRTTLKMLEGVDVSHAYAPISDDTVLHALQKEIVLFEKHFSEKKPDSSLRLFLTGASKLHEVEVIAEEILHRGIPFSDIQIYALDIETYAPLLEFVFSRRSIPFRISPLSSKNHGMERLIALAKGKWNKENVIDLFAGHFSLQEKEIELLHEIYKIADTWEKGIQELLLRSIHLLPGPPMETTPLSQFDSLEKLLELLTCLKEDLNCHESLTLEKWAEKWEAIAEKYIQLEVSFQSLRQAKVDGVFPFEIVEEFLNQTEHHSFQANYLHAVTLNSLQEGVVFPARASFLLGMDEMSFPRKKQATSLDLVKKEPDIADIDRYLFLQILLNTKDVVTMSYAHISEEDGKTVGPSILIQELQDAWGDGIAQETKMSFSPEKKDLTQFTFGCKNELPINNMILSLSDLTFFARHPWKYYLQKQENIVLEERNERSFKAKRSLLAKSSLVWPLDALLPSRKEKYPGIFEEAFVVDVEEKANQFQKQIETWGKKRQSISFYQTANGNEFPALQFDNVQIIGDIPYCLEDGALHFGEDTIGSILKVWPEILAACIALNTNKIYFLKSGKIKTVSNPRESLKNFVDYYLRCFESLTPLIPDWADALLKSKPFSPDFDYEDEVHKWLMPRLKIEELDEWEWLKTSFANLIEIYEKV